MNNVLFAFAFVAVFAAVASATPTVNAPDDEESQFTFGFLTGFPADADEKKGLEPEHVLFGDFCIRSRDAVKVHADEKMSEKVSSAFDFLTNTFSETVSAIGIKGTEAVAQGKARVESESFKSIADVLASIAKIVYQAAKTETMSRAEMIKQNLDTDTLLDTVKDECRHLSMGLKRKIENMFNEAKYQILKSKDLAPEVKMAVKTAKAKSVGCATSKRFFKVALGCELISAIYPLAEGWFKN